MAIVVCLGRFDYDRLPRYPCSVSDRRRFLRLAALRSQVFELSARKALHLIDHIHHTVLKNITPDVKTSA